MYQTFSVLIEQVEGWWTAQCIEQDIATQARSLDELHPEILRMLAAHLDVCEELGIESFNLPPAPPEVREKFELARTQVGQPADSGNLSVITVTVKIKT